MLTVDMWMYIVTNVTRDFLTKRNLRGHIKKKHEIKDDTLSDMVDRAEFSYPELRTPKYNLVDEGVFPNKVYLLAVYVNITTHS